jgi:hypothetical protein
MLQCHVCRQPWDRHAPDCRVVVDMGRLRRVYDRLVAEDREEALRDKIGRYLGLFGALPCQKRPEPPTSHDCRACGHADACVIMPPEMGGPLALAG